MSRLRWPFAALLALAALLISGSPVVAAPGGASRIVARDQAGPQRSEITVYSAAMGREIPLTVLHPAGGGAAPTLYLLNGAGGGEDAANWGARTDYERFFADKQVIVVTPQQGAFSYYTDWQRDDPRLGRQKWETFLARELPPLIDAEFNGNGRNAIAGISMSGTSVLNLAQHHPERYRAVASYSGCARTSDPLGQAYIRAVIEDRGKADVENMWGPVGGPGWVANDPYVNAHKLRGTTVYLSSNTGLPGPDESYAGIRDLDAAAVMTDKIILGGGIEAAMYACTTELAQRLADLGIPATVHIRETGTHSWGYWERELKESWPTLARALR